MDKPTLLVVAGCNGSGKSSFSKALLPDDLKNAFDYDKVFLSKYESLMDSELRDVMAHNMSRNELENVIESAISSNCSFCYETNFNSTPLYWPEKFKQHNYKVEIAFFCLDSTIKAKERVKIRVENGGHHVPDNEIESRFNLGYKHLNEHWHFFDTVHLFNTSAYNEIPEHLVTINNGVDLVKSKPLPEFLKDRLPNIISKI